MKRVFFFLVLSSAVAAGPAPAEVPSTMSYQGVLMDDGGAFVPDGDYSLTFMLYTIPEGGAPIWGETQSPVAVSRGVFSVILGSVAPLDGLAFDVPCWLGITVGPGTELSPRVRLASSPYALSLRLPFLGGAPSSVAALAIANPGGGPAITADPRLDIGTPSNDGTLYVHGNNTIGAAIYQWAGFGEELDLFDAGGNMTMGLQPDVNGNAGYLYVRGGNGGFYVDGNTGSGSPTLFVAGNASASYFQTDWTGDNAVLLPDNSISSYEVRDEPGIAQGYEYGMAHPAFGTTTMSDIVTVSLTTPAWGYIVVEADAQHNIGGNETAIANYAVFQIDETAGGEIDPGHQFTSGYTSGDFGTHNFVAWAPVSIRRTYYKPAGTYTFRLESYGYQTESVENFFLNPTITATYYPSSYGPVTTEVTAAEAAQFQGVRRAVSPLPQGGSAEGALVDLRELELRDAEARARADRAHRELLEARLAEQSARVTKSATAGRR